MQTKIKIDGLKEARQRLLKMGDAAAIKRKNKEAGKAALEPALRMAKFLAPKKSGLLAESLGITTRDAGNDMIFAIVPRRSFAAGNTAVADSKTSKAAHEKKGRNVHKGVPPYFYAIIVETGQLPVGDASTRFSDPQLGAKVRDANPFLGNTFERTHRKIPEHYINHIMGHVAQHAA